MLIDHVVDNAFMPLRIYAKVNFNSAMMQCPKCGATWESPDGANEMQFIICKDCYRKVKHRPAKFLGSYAYSLP